MHHMFTPSGRKGKEYQLFLPLTCILKVNPQNLGGQVEEQQTAILEKSKKEADKVKVKGILKLDEKDIDDTMNTETQQEILEKIKQARSNQRSQGGASSHSDSPQAADQKFSRQNVQHYIHPGSEHSYPLSVSPGSTILRAGEMELPEVSYKP